MKFSLFVFAFVSLSLLSCNDKTDNRKADYNLLQERFSGAEDRIDSLISVMKERELLKKTASQKKIKAKKKSKVADNNLSAPARNDASEHTWKSVNNQTIPSYRPVKEKEAYQVRVGAVCCDGSRSYATGRGACSHHGGVCQWLYQ